MNQNEPFLERITVDPEIRHGRPCICGLCHPVNNDTKSVGSGGDGDGIAFGLR
jgi:uncharacterized protein (DUF433 family)